MPRSDAVKLQHWTKQIREWEASGVSQRAYCEREGLKFAAFDYWRRQVRSNSAAAKPELNPTERLTLVPVRVTSKQYEGEITLRSPGGWQLSMPASLDSQWLAAFLRGLP